MNFVQYFKNNPVIFYVCLVALILLLVFIMSAIIVGLKNKKNNKSVKNDETDQLTLVKQTLKEDKENKTSKEEVKKAEPVVEEEKTEETVKEEKPVEDKTPVLNEEPVVEEEHENDPEDEVVPAKPKAKPKKATPTKTRVVQGKYELLYDGESYFYQLKASNGELLVKSENYSSKASCVAAIDRLKVNSVEGTIEITKDKRDNYQFSLVSKNHRTLVVSANYSSEASAISASESFKRFAPNAPVIEKKEEAEAKEVIEIDTINKNGGKFVVATEADQYFLQLKASNGEVIAQAKKCKTEQAALNTVSAFKDAVKNGKFCLEKDKRGYYFYKLYSASNRIVCVGESYESRLQAISAANSVASFTENAIVIE